MSTDTLDRRPARELDDTPGTRIPTEHLADSPVGRHVARKRQRLEMAWGLYCSLHAGHTTAINGDPTKARQWCWDQADKFLAEGDRPTTAPPLAAPVAAVAPTPPINAQRDYLEWLAEPSRGGSCLTSEHPPGMYEADAAGVRRTLLKRGLIAATHKGGSLEVTGYTLTAAGWARVTPSDSDVESDPDTTLERVA